MGRSLNEPEPDMRDPVPDPIFVLVVASSTISRLGLVSLLDRDPLRVVGQTRIPELTAQIEALEPDAVVLEWNELDPIPEASLWLEDKNLAWVILSASGDPLFWGELAQGRALLTREATAEEIRQAVQAAVAGLWVIHPDHLRWSVALSLTSAGNSALGETPPQLTPREIEVLTLLAEGSGNKTIAKQLHISEHTVKFHITSLFNKLGATSRTEAVTAGIKLGLILL
ncbi:response regulator transcription factor [Synechococcus sp. Nb3U1]|uniref:response regulator transcription factor n=1 Tax=Synechococcus sp. Nb3U1 TaxID=1914529 RepID=UPI001F432395|nr:response regulator transcription factor [Synechococcus sp. Nb3U1]MCF2970584.1 response regulator transcription factor [Synechococcus sp. Nb3U1]